MPISIWYLKPSTVCHVLVFFWCIIPNYHKFSRLKHLFIVSEIQESSDGDLALGLKRSKSRSKPTSLLYGGSGGKSTSSSLQIVGRTVSCNRRTAWIEVLFPCWLLTGDHSQFLEAAHILWLAASFSKPTMVHWIVLVLWISLTSPAFLFYHYLRRISAFKGSYTQLIPSDHPHSILTVYLFLPSFFGIDCIFPFTLHYPASPPGPADPLTSKNSSIKNHSQCNGAEGS